MSRGQVIDRDVRVGAVADYLVGRKLTDILHKRGVHPATVQNWIRDVGCFKLRRASRQDCPRPNRR